MSATISLASVVTTANVLIHSADAGSFQFSQGLERCCLQFRADKGLKESPEPAFSPTCGFLGGAAYARRRDRASWRNADSLNPCPDRPLESGNRTNPNHPHL